MVERISKQSIFTETFFINLAIVALVWLSMLYFGTPTATDHLDQSWNQSLGYAFKHNFQAGIEYLFTYGPLGYFYSPSSGYDVDLFYQFVSWHIVFGLFLTIIFVGHAQKIDNKIDKFIYLFLVITIISTPIVFDSKYFLAIIASMILVVSPLPIFTHHPYIYAILIGLVLIFLAVVSLTKFTLFVLAILAILCITTMIWHAYSHKLAIVIPFTFTILILTVWLIIGQSLFNLPTFIINSLQITSGYSEAMANGFNFTEIKLAMLSIFVISLMTLLGSFIKPWRIERFIIAGMIFLGILLAWKAGFVRHDTHSFTFFAFAILVPFFIEYNKNMHKYLLLTFRTLRYIAILVALNGFFMVGETIGYNYSNFIGKWNQQLIENFDIITNLKSKADEKERYTEVLKQQFALPKISGVVGQATVDIFSWEQGVLFLNEFDWRPRPIFQSYSVYTPTLIGMNGDFYASNQAPEFVIFKLQTIDWQFPLMNDNEALKILLRDYKPVLSEKGYLLFKRMPRGQGRVLTGETLLEREIKINEQLDIRTLSAGPLLLSLNIRKSWLGRIMSLLYKLPTFNLEIETTDGAKMSYRIIPGMTQSAFVINPLILEQKSLINWYLKTELQRVATLRVVVKPDLGIQYIFDTNITLKISEYKTTPYPIDDMVKQNLLTGFYPMFHSIPYQVSSPSHQASEEGQSVLMVHARGEMRFRVHPGKHTLTGQFGILKGAYNVGNDLPPTDGVEFSAVIRETNGRELLLFKRFLNPLLREADRGLQTITTAPFVTETEAELVLHTHPGAANNSRYDWSFWEAIKID